MPFLLVDFPVFDPVALALGPIVIRWYALAYIVGIVLGSREDLGPLLERMHEGHIGHVVQLVHSLAKRR